LLYGMNNCDALARAVVRRATPTGDRPTEPRRVNNQQCTKGVRRVYAIFAPRTVYGGCTVSVLHGSPTVYGGSTAVGGPRVYGSVRLSVVGVPRVYGSVRLSVVGVPRCTAVYGCRWSTVYGGTTVYSRSVLRGVQQVYGRSVLRGVQQVYGRSVLRGVRRCTAGVRRCLLRGYGVRSG